MPKYVKQTIFTGTPQFIIHETCINQNFSFKMTEANRSFLHFLVSEIRIAFTLTLRLTKPLLQRTILMFKFMLREIHTMELQILQMHNIYTFVCQLLFLTMCEIAILDASSTDNESDTRKGIVGLSALLFYNVFGYFVKKISEIFEADPTVRQEQAVLYVKYVIKIILEWAKAIAVVFCIRDKGITIQPDLYYITVTFLYYLCTEKLFIDLIVNFTRYLNIQLLDSMEHLYVPIVLNVYTLLCAFAVTGYLLGGPHATYALCASYFILYLRAKNCYCNYIKVLKVEKQTYASFRNASNSEIQKWDDICAVCLNNMSRAKITPCNHLFHPACLKQCLRTSLQCPLCKHKFAQ